MQQLTFTQEEIDNMKGFAKFVAEKARFSDLDWADAVQLARFNGFVVAHIRKMQDHVMELSRIVEPVEETESASKSRGRGRGSK